MPKRDFLTIPDFSRSELDSLFDLAARMKSNTYN
jgi:ornithine carbamoyltransferase